MDEAHYTSSLHYSVQTFTATVLHPESEDDF